jgi:hypothetical protein
MRQASVIGQQQHPFGVHIQTSDWEEPHRLSFEQIEDRTAALLILARGDIAARLVQQDIPQGCLQTERLTVHDDHIRCGIDSATQRRNLFAVDNHSSLYDQCLSLAPGRHSSLGNDFVEPYFLFRYCVLFHVLKILHFPGA